jgi:hypothetical protein
LREQILHGKKSKKRSSFLKKRTKKLLLIGPAVETAARPIHQSFLLPFFKKEALAYIL